MTLINREFSHPVLPEIMKRWSPRAFDASRPVSEDDLLALLEAARYAPSCTNEQPWQYVVASGGEDKEKLTAVLSERNKEWASHAPVLLLIVSRKSFGDGRENRWHQFDAGTSWGFLQLEAQRRGLITHGMAGYDVAKAREAFGIPDDYSVLAAVAVGYYGKKEDLSSGFQGREHPQPRKPLEDMFFRHEK